MKRKTKNKKIVRFVDLGYSSSLLPRGPENKISDVPGVMVGHVTNYDRLSGICTGVTIIDPGVHEIYRNKIPAAVCIGNGSGKVAGTTQIEELGTLETPIALTNTHMVGTVMQGLADLVADTTPNLGPRDTINAVVGETNDGYLNTIRKSSVSARDVRRAYENRKKDFAIGSVGAGKGTRAFAWKGGIGTASRVIAVRGKKYTLGALVQTNFGGSLMIHGVDAGAILGKNDFDLPAKKYGDGSCIIVIASDAPLSSRQLKRIASRAFLGLARTGSVLAPFSGDYAFAFSTRRDAVETGKRKSGGSIEDAALMQFFLAAVETVEESVHDAMFAAKTTIGRDGNVLLRLPYEKLAPYFSRK